MSKISLRRMNSGDISLFKNWLYRSHVSKWYTQPEDWLNEFEKRESEFNWIHHFMAEVDGVAIGFCQYYQYSMSGEDWYKDGSEQDVYSIDYMIGEETYLRKGFGKAIVLLLEKEIRKNTDARKIIVQPESENKVSRKTLLSAGYLLDEVNEVFYKRL